MDRMGDVEALFSFCFREEVMSLALVGLLVVHFDLYGRGIRAVYVTLAPHVFDAQLSIVPVLEPRAVELGLLKAVHYKITLVELSLLDIPRVASIDESLRLLNSLSHALLSAILEAQVVVGRS